MALVTKNFSDIITFTRASTATFFNSAGVLTSAAVNAPRFDYNPSTLAAQGLLIEAESRTNSIRNNTMQGAVAPSTFPTNWQSAIVSGLTSTVVGTGTLNGITYLDVRVNGTASVSSYYNLVPDILVAGSSGQTWTGSFWAALVGGSLSNTNANIEIRESDASQGFLTNTLTLLSITSSLARYSQARTLNSASTAFVSVRFVWQVTAGQPVDFTLRIGLPQLEQGAFATSVIPTTTTALTRAADVASVNPLSPWYNSVAGTLYVQGILVGGTAATFPYQAALVGSNANNDSIGVNWTAASGLMRFGVRSGGVAQADIPAGSGKSAGSSYKVAGRYAANDFQAAGDGSLGTADTSGSVPTITALSLGGPVAFQVGASVWLQRVTYYPQGLSNAQLQAITA
jgi:hypothetical protein